MDSKKTAGRGTALYEWVRALISSVLAVVLLFTFVVRLVRVDGESMRETLQDQDLLLTLNAPLCRDYRAGDIVVLRKATFRDGAPIVKRIVATEGQTVDIDFNEGVVWVDGEALEEPYTREPTWTPEGLTFPVTVPEGHVFVLGDNRNDSSDSRSADLGPIDERMLLGKVLLVVVPGRSAESNARAWNRVGALD